MHVIRFYGRPRHAPASGDRRMLRGVEHIRVPRRVTDGPNRGAYVVSGSRQLYDWVPLDQAPEHLRSFSGRWVGKPRPA